MRQETEKPYVVGVDLGGTNVRAAVLERATETIVARGENLPSLAMDGVEQTAASSVVNWGEGVPKCSILLLNASCINTWKRCHPTSSARFLTSPVL